MSRPRKPPTESTRLDSELLHKIRFIAADRKLSVPECLYELLKDQVDAEFRKVAQNLAKRRQQQAE